MNLWKTMDEYLDDYSPKEKKVYDLIKKEPYSFASSTAMEIADKYHISQSSISRFCKRLGFNGFSDFRMSLIVSAKPDVTAEQKDMPSYDEVLSDYLKLVSQSLDHKQLDTLCDRIMGCRTLYTSGYGISDIAARYLTFNMTIMNVSSLHIVPSYEVEQLHTMDDSDVLILFSSSNPSHRDMFQTLKDLPKERWPYIVLICLNKNHSFRKLADQTIILPDQSLINSPYFLNTSIAQMNFIQIFANYYRESTHHD